MASKMQALHRVCSASPGTPQGKLARKQAQKYRRKKKWRDVLRGRATAINTVPELVFDVFLRNSTFPSPLDEINMSLASTSEELPEGWEAVQDDQGRTYFWNVDTNDVMWTRPVVVKATKGIAARACRVLCLFTPACLLITCHRRSQGTSRR